MARAGAQLAALLCAWVLAGSAGAQVGGNPGGSPGSEGQPGYPGPGDTVPPPPPPARAPGGGPASPGTPPSPGDAPSGGGGGTPGARPGGPAAPPQAPSGPGSGAPETARGGAAADPSDWRIWWALNRDPYLQLRAARSRVGRPTLGDDAYLGLGEVSVPRVPHQPGEPEVLERVLPALERALRTESDPGILADAAVALALAGRTFAPGQAERWIAALAARVGDSNQAVGEAAVLALGLLRSPRAAPLLAALAGDEPAGRELCGRSRVPERLRTFAAVGLGLSAERTHMPDLARYVVHRLVAVLEEGRQPSADLGAGCALGLSLARLSGAPLASLADAAAPASSSREALAHFLTGTAGERRLREEVRAHVPRALAAVARDGGEELRAAVARELIELLERSRKAGRLVRAGCVLSLGAIGDAGEGRLDREIRDALARALRDGDLLLRGFALVALAESGSRPGADASRPFAASAEVHELLLRHFVHGRSNLRPWAALALGIQGHGLTAGGNALSPATDAALRERYASSPPPSEAGAIAIALGLRKNREALPLLLDALPRTGDEEARGHVAVAIGLLESQDSFAALRAELGRAASRPALLAELAIGLVLAGDASASDALIELGRARSSSQVLGAVGRALSCGVDARAIDFLLGVLEDESIPARARRSAAAALGAICELDPLPWKAAITNGLNYPARTDVLDGLEGAGLIALR